MKRAVSFPVFVALWNRHQSLGTPDVHFRIAHFLGENWRLGHKRLLLMAFRACGKSTLVGLFCVWLLFRDPSLRILVLSADIALAQKMVRHTRRILELHPLTRHLKPERPDQWGADRFTVERASELRDPSMLAKGITSNLTGTRADVIICDDVEVPQTSDSEDKRRMLRERLKETEFILTPDGTQLFVGTPHSSGSIYRGDNDAADEEGVFLADYKRLVVPVVNDLGESVWPERFSPARIDELKRRNGPAHFQSQMLCQCVAFKDGYFNPDHVPVYDFDMGAREVHGRTVRTLGDYKILSVEAYWDPAFGQDGRDRSVVAVVLGDSEGGFWLHRLAVLRTSARSSDDEATQQCRQVIELVRDMNLPSVVLETNGLGQFLPGILRREIGEAGLSCAVRPVHNHQSKASRILDALDAVLAARALRMHRSVLQTPFVRELASWSGPNSKGHDDCLDAVAGALALHPVRVFRCRRDGKDPAV